MNGHVGQISALPRGRIAPQTLGLVVMWVSPVALLVRMDQGEPLGNRPYGRHAGSWSLRSPMTCDLWLFRGGRHWPLFGRDYVNPGSRCRSCEGSAS